MDVVAADQVEHAVALEQVVDVLDVGEVDAHRAGPEVAEQGEQHLAGAVVDVGDRREVEDDPN